MYSSCKCPQCHRQRDAEEIYPATTSDCLPHPCNLCKKKNNKPDKDMYRCSRCMQVKHIDLFTKHKSQKVCKSCHNQWVADNQKEFKYKKFHRDKIA
jgi:hypothetical protein